jgi:hypothetical protein
VTRLRKRTPILDAIVPAFGNGAEKVRGRDRDLTSVHEPTSDIAILIAQEPGDDDTPQRAATSSSSSYSPIYSTIIYSPQSQTNQSHAFFTIDRVSSLLPTNVHALSLHGSSSSNKRRLKAFSIITCHVPCRMPEKVLRFVDEKRRRRRR